MNAKETLVHYVTKMETTRQKYHDMAVAMQNHVNYTDTYKKKQIERINTDCINEMRLSANAANNICKDALKAYEAFKKGVIAKRTNEGYNLGLQNAVKTFESVGGSLSGQQVQDLLAPFIHDDIAILTLKNAADKGGMNSIQALKEFPNPKNAITEKLNTLMAQIDEYAERSVEDRDVPFSANLPFFVSFISSHYPDDLVGISDKVS